MVTVLSYSSIIAARVTSVILFNPCQKSNLRMRTGHSLQYLLGKFLLMSEDTKLLSRGSDWTRLLTDPDLVTHIGKLLQTYRDVSPEQREAALLHAMREIKDAAIKGREQQAKPPENAQPGESKKEESKPEESKPEESKQELSKQEEPVKIEGTVEQNVASVAAAEPVPASASAPTADSVAASAASSAASPAPVSTPAAQAAPPAELPRPEPMDQAPPFEPAAFAPEAGRRRFQRVKCYVAVEIHIDGQEAPVWGNLANVSRGGCLVETASAVPSGKVLEIGLWVASGKIWVKGVILSGVATRSASFGVRVKFSESELSEKEHLREFLKFVETSARKSQSEKAYVTQLKS